LRSFEFGEELPDRAEPPVLRIFEALANAFLGVCLRGSIMISFNRASD